MYRLDISEDEKLIIIVCLHKVVYSRRFHGQEIEHAIFCKDEAELTKAVADLEDREIPYEVVTEEPTAELLALDKTEVSGIEEAKRRIDGTWKPPVTLEQLEQENLDLKLALVELYEMII